MVSTVNGVETNSQLAHGLLANDLNLVDRYLKIFALFECFDSDLSAAVSGHVVYLVYDSRSCRITGFDALEKLLDQVPF